MARRELDAGLELDDDPARVDVEAVFQFLSEQSYWAKGRARQVIEELIRASTRVIGLYEGDRQVGFARVVSDGHVVAYLADVYVLPELRGRGLGVELVREAVENGPHARCTWLLHTNDAQGLYDKFGFGPPNEHLLERRKRT